MAAERSEIEEYLHRCDTPGVQPLPDDVSRIIYRWKCPVCRQKWRITSWESNSQAVPYGWRWRRWRPDVSGRAGDALMATLGSVVVACFWLALFASLVGMAVKPWRDTR